MNILLTGATGFLGRNLLQGLSSAPTDNIFAAYRDKSKKFFPNGPNGQLVNWIAAEKVEYILKTEKIDCIIHTATNYGRHNDSILNIQTTNTHWPLAILESSRKHNVPLFIKTGTSLPDQLNAYALSKAQFRDWGKYLTKQSSTRVFHIKLEHMYGPDSDNLKFTNYLINSCRDEVPYIDLTSGEAKRDFIYIDNVVQAYQCLIDKHQQFQYGYHEFGLGSGQAISIRSLAEAVKKITNSPTVLNFGAITYRENEVMYSVADISELHKLGWTCQIDIQTGIRKSLEY